jgi:toxin CcdB
MNQFALHRNANPRSQREAHYLRDVQNDPIDALATRVVMPVCPERSVGGAVFVRLTPVLEVDGERYVALTPQLAGIAKKELGAAMADLSGRRAEVIGALDMLVTGI